MPRRYIGVPESVAWMELGPASWLHAWYDVVADLPAARGCDARLVVVEKILIDGELMFGIFDIEENEITVAISDTPEVMLSTLIHEVAHVASNPRHRRFHGYSWRRTFGQLLAELTGIRHAERLADSWRRSPRQRKYRHTRMYALDVLAEQVSSLPSLTLDERHIKLRTPTLRRDMPR